LQRIHQFLNRLLAYIKKEQLSQSEPFLGYYPFWLINNLILPKKKLLLRD